MEEILLWLSGILGFSANIPYIYQIIISKDAQEPIQPIRISWIIWFVLDLLIVLNLLDNDKALLENALPVGYMLGAFLVALLSFPYGTWVDSDSKTGSLSDYKQEILILIICLVGILIWQFSSSEISLIAFCSALVVSALPTLKRAWKKPESEPTLPWTMWFVAAMLSVICLGDPRDWTIIGSIVTLVYLGLNIPMMISLYLRK